MHPVICPHCDEPSRVPAAAAGKTVACPHCGEPFPVPKVARPIPVVQPYRDPETEPIPRGPTSVLVGLALLPFTIPMVWFVGPMLTGVDPIFTLAMPIAVAAGTSGVALGVVFTRDWSHGTRVKGILALFALAAAAAAFLFFLPKEWLETVRARVGGSGFPRKYEPTDGAFQVMVPGAARPEKTTSPITGWDLRTARFSPPPRKVDVYMVAHGKPPKEFEDKPDEAFFAAVKAAVVAAAGETEWRETDFTHQSHAGREFAAVLPDKVTNRTVRVVRAGAWAYYLAVDGPHLRADAPDVKRFFDSLFVRRK